MLDTTGILTASTVCIAGIISPGPNFVAVTHRAMTATRAEAFALVFGVACVSSLWAAAALFGIGVLFSLFPWLFWSVKLLGAAYLVWFGLQLLRHARTPLSGRPHFSSRSNVVRALRDGIVTNLSNPKAMVFYASVFSTAVPSGASVPTLVVLVSMVALIASLWYGGVVLVLSSEPVARVYRRITVIVERSCGLFLIAFGIKQCLLRR